MESELYISISRIHLEMKLILESANEHSYRVKCNLGDKEL